MNSEELLARIKSLEDDNIDLKRRVSNLEGAINVINTRVLDAVRKLSRDHYVAT